MKISTYRILNFLILLLLTLSLAGCKLQSARSESVNTDSVRVEIRYRNVPVAIPGDSIPFEVQIPCPDVKPVSIKSKGKSAGVNLSVKNGKVTGVCTCSEYKVTIQAKDTEINRLRKESRSTHSVEYIKEVAWYDMANRWILFTILIYLIIKYGLKYFLKIR